MAEMRHAKQQDTKKIYGVYIKSLLTSKMYLSMNEVGKNVKQNLERMISKQTEGKCIPEGFIRPGSAKVVSYSAGVINNEKVEFQVVYECMICNPVEGMLIEAVVKTVTKAGIHAEVIDDESGAIPIVAFVARDHSFNDKQFSAVKENMKIVVRVIGSRFELFDKNIWVIGKLVEQSNDSFGHRNTKPKRPQLKILGGNVEVEVDEDEDDENEEE